MSGCLCHALCCRMTVFVEKAKKMGRTSLIAELDRYIHVYISYCISELLLLQGAHTICMRPHTACKMHSRLTYGPATEVLLTMWCCCVQESPSECRGAQWAGGGGSGWSKDQRTDCRIQGELLVHSTSLAIIIVYCTFLYVDCATQLCPFSATVDSWETQEQIQECSAQWVLLHPPYIHPLTHPLTLHSH